MRAEVVERESLKCAVEQCVAADERRGENGRHSQRNAVLDAQQESDEMNLRDVALIAYRLLALWFGVSGMMALAETLLTWKSVWAQSQAVMAGTSNPTTETGFLLMTTSALAARALLGALLWWAAPALARHTPVGQPSPESQEPSRAVLFSAAAFLVGVWLLSVSLPGLAYVGFSATRPGVPAYDDGLGGARVAQLLAQLLLGVAFVRGGWLVDLAVWSRGSTGEPSPPGQTAPPG